MTTLNSQNFNNDKGLPAPHNSIPPSDTEREIAAAEALPLPEPIRLRDYIMNVTLYCAILESILRRFAAYTNALLFMTADNCPLNRAIASSLNVPPIGCHAHLLNLGVRKFWKEHNSVLDKVHRLMVCCRRTNALRQYISDFAVVPAVASSIRWRAIDSMIACYQRIRTLKPYEQTAKLADLQLTAGENDIIDAVALPVPSWDSVSTCRARPASLFLT